MKRSNVDLILKFILGLMDLSIVVFSFFSATILKYGSLHHPYFSSRPLTAILVVILFLFGAIFYFVGFYKEKRGVFYELDEVGTIVLGCSLAALSMVFFTYFSREALYSRRVVVYAWIFSIVLISVVHLLFLRLLHWFYRKEIGSKKIIIVGEGKESNAIQEKIRKFPTMGYQVIGNDPGQDIKLLDEKLRELSPDGVIVALSKDDFSRMVDIIQICEEHRLEIWVVPGILELIARKVEVDDVDGIPLINLREPVSIKLQYLMKRTMDVLVSSFLLVVISPFLLLVSALVKFTSEGPVFYVQERIGLHGKPFSFIKFRTMYKDAEAKLDEVMQEKGSRDVFIKIKDDPRITPLGGWLRRLSVDELPQLVNVMKGEMSLVGPRPLFRKGVESSPPWMRKRLKVKPGITGLWQISGRSERSDEESVMLDIYYIEHWSFWLDLKILMYTIPAVLTAKGAT